MRAVLRLYRNHSVLEQRLSSPTAGRCLTQRESVTAASYGLSPPTGERPERQLDLFQLRSVEKIQRPVDLRQVPAQPAGELGLADPGLPHRPVESDFGGGHRREGHALLATANR